MIQLDGKIVVNVLRDIYREVYPLDDLTGEFIIRYYLGKLDLPDTRESRLLIGDYIRLSRDHGQPVSIKFKTANRLVREHNRLARLYDEKEISAERFLPLIAENTDFADLRRILPDEFEWITTTGRLFEEGRAQDNCVFSYRDKIREDRSTIYHWSNDGRSYTIEFGHSSDGRYSIEQMLQAKNAKACPSDIEYVKRCLGSRLWERSEGAAGNDPRLLDGFEGFEDPEIPF